MKKFITETVLILIGCTLFYLAYYLTQGLFGSEGKTAFVVIAFLLEQLGQQSDILYCYG